MTDRHYDPHWGVETQTTIRDWAQTNFGPASDMYRVQARAFEELVEAMKEISTGGSPEKIAVECADVVITLAGRMVLDLAQLAFAEYGGPSYDIKQDICCAAQQLGRAMASTALMGPDFEAPSLVGSCVALLWGICGKLGVDLADAIDAKMQINRARRWAKSTDGTSYHIKP